MTHRPKDVWDGRYPSEKKVPKEASKEKKKKSLVYCWNCVSVSQHIHVSELIVTEQCQCGYGPQITELKPDGTPDKCGVASNKEYGTTCDHYRCAHCEIFAMMR